MKRGICPVCRAEFDVTKAGGMRDHRGDVSVGGWRQTCEGVGQPPAGAAPDPLAEAERRGLLRAVAVMRDDDAYQRWHHLNAIGPDGRSYVPAVLRDVCADFLEYTAEQDQPSRW